MKAAIICLALAVAMLYGYIVGTLTPRIYSDNQEVTKAICDYSRTVRSGDWEEACGLARELTYKEEQ